MAQAKSFTKSQPVVEIGLRWTSANAEKHANSHTFIRVGGEKASTRSLSGGPRSWSSPDPEENNTVFVLPLRISGTPEHIRQSLRLTQPPYTDEEITEFLNDAITKDNYKTTKAEEYNAEIEAYKKMMDEKIPPEHYSAEQLNWFCEPEIIKNVRVESKKSAPKTNGAEPTKTRTSPGASLKDRIAQLKDGYILDISGMTSDFKSIKAVPIPTTNRSAKFYSVPLPFLTNDYDKYYEIVNHVYGADGLIQFAGNLEDIKNQLVNGKSNRSFKSLIPQPQSNTTSTTKTLPPKPTSAPQGLPSTKSAKVGIINPTAVEGLPTMK